MSLDRDRKARLEIVEAGAHLRLGGLILPGEGNLSHRSDDGYFLVTPAGSDKGRLGVPDLVKAHVDPARVPARASSELRVHLEIYMQCPRVNAIVHAHSPQVQALSSIGAMPDCGLLFEAGELLGQICSVGSLQPGSEELAFAVTRCLGTANVCVMEQHGAITVAENMKVALRRMLLLERLAGLTLAAMNA